MARSKRLGIVTRELACWGVAIDASKNESEVEHTTYEDEETDVDVQAERNIKTPPVKRLTMTISTTTTTAMTTNDQSAGLL